MKSPGDEPSPGGWLTLGLFASYAQALYRLFAPYVLAIVPEVDRINLGNNSKHIGST
jgi:hypothetical protein